MPKKIVVYSPSRFTQDVWLPALWCQSKTYYEKHGQHAAEWEWIPCLADLYGDDYEKIKNFLLDINPDVFAVSLYVWNYWIGHDIAKWVKQQWPNCVVITGGPHQYFKHDMQWFKKYPYIDASLPGDSYGELCLQELLDSLNESVIDYESITNLCYPYGKSRILRHSAKTLTLQTKKQFDYNWPSFAMQKNHVDYFVDHARKINPRCKILAVLETTRGCPYGCTYCDWGGGINTTVIKKSIESVKKDIELLKTYKLRYLYIADANFGIFGERDIAIMKLLTDCNQLGSNLKLGYGGFAKTENKIDYIKQILELDIKHEMSNAKEIKLSMQSLNPDVLQNIDRKNINLDVQLAKFSNLAGNKKLPIYVEMILGLPGMNLHKFYQELDELGAHRLSVMWFEWLLLPEAPAYSHNYRKQFGIKTINKTHGWVFNEIGSDREIVIETNTYSSDDYLEMLLATGLYHAVIQGGMFDRSISWINKKKNVGIGTIVSVLLKHMPDKQQLFAQWHEIVNNPAQAAQLILPNGKPIYAGFYYSMMAFLDENKFLKTISNILESEFKCPTKLLEYDQARAITWSNCNTKTAWLDFNVNNNTVDAFNTVLEQFINYKNSGRILKAKQRWFDFSLL
jgi:putative methyltransferase